MRSHAKASSAGSSTHRATGLGRIVRGAAATRALSRRTDGRGAPSQRRPRLRSIAVLGLALVAAMAITSSSAFAIETHPYTGLSFGPDGTTATSFVNPRGLAVDQTSGDVYVYDTGAGGKIYKFDAAGNPVDFSALTGNAIEGVGGSGFGELELAIAPAGSPGGTAGDIYVARNNGSIKIYAPSGIELGELSGGGGTCGVAVSPAGHLFLGIYPSKVKEFIPSANPVTSADLSGESSASLPGICNVAADGLANVYAANYAGSQVAKLEGIADSTPTTVASGGRTIAVDPANDDLYVDGGSIIRQFSSGGTLIATFGGGVLTNSIGIATDATSGKVYANNEGKVFVFGPLVIVPTVTSEDATGVSARKATLHGKVNPEGIAVTECQFEYGPTTAYGETAPCEGSIPTDSADHAVSAELAGLDPNTTYHFRIVAENANGANANDDATFETTKTAVTGTGTPLSGSKAEVTGTVYPEGAPISECRFEYGESTGYGFSVACAESSAQIGTGGGPVSVHAEVPGLESSTEYHFRLVAKSDALPQAETGADATFVTLGPVIDSSSVDWSSITTTSARLDAQINPQGQGTSYHVEYVTQGEFDQSGFAGARTFPAGVNGIGNGFTNVPVSPQLSGLSPAVTYHARFVATNVSGTAYGPDLVFAPYPNYGSLGSCPQNQVFRTGSSAALPDCRAYEQASPVDKNGTDVRGRWAHSEASRSGDAVLFQVQSGVPGGSGSSDYPIYVARRGASGWTTHGLLPPPSFGQWSTVRSWTTDLNLGFSRSIKVSETSQENGMAVADLTNNTFQSWFPYPTAGAPFFAAASNDDSKVFFEWTVSGGGLPVTSGPAPATGKDNLYMYDRATEELTVVGVLPASEGGAAPSFGSFGGPYDWFTGETSTTLLRRGGASRGYFTQAGYVASTSGDRAFFTAGGTGQIYARLGLDTATPETVRVSASHRASADVEKPAIFMRATPSGSDAFFTSCQKLTEDSTAVSTSAFRCDQSTQGADLYRWQADGAGSCEEAGGCLIDLTIDGSDPKGAQVQGVIGTSDNGEYAYFVANGILASNEGAQGSHASLGDCGEYSNGSGFLNAKGDCNLYLWHDNDTENGETTFIAPLTNTAKSFAFDAAAWEALSAGITAPNPEGFVSADGKTLIFSSLLKQSAARNDDGGEFYRYQVGETEPICVTCDPTGAPGVTGYLTSQTILASFNTGSVMDRNMSADGNRFFFESPGKFVPADTNGDAGCPLESNSAGGNPLCQDVYEWEASGTGSCHTSPGCYYLLSSGTSSAPAYFNDASVSGDDVFIFTHDQLVPQDEDELQDVYDVSVDGGLASQHPVSPPTCEAEGCRGAGTGTPSVGGAGTAAFQGPGNPEPEHRCAKGLARRHGKCVKQHRRKRHHKRARRRNANRNRRAAR